MYVPLSLIHFVWRPGRYGPRFTAICQFVYFRESLESVIAYSNNIRTDRNAWTSSGSYSSRFSSSFFSFFFHFFSFYFILFRRPEWESLLNVNSLHLLHYHTHPRQREKTFSPSGNLKLGHIRASQNYSLSKNRWLVKITEQEEMLIPFRCSFLKT